LAWTEKRALATGALRATCAARGLNFLAPTRRMAAALAATAEVERTANIVVGGSVRKVASEARGRWFKKKNG
jgi:hypothetical protein